MSSGRKGVQQMGMSRDELLLRIESYKSLVRQGEAKVARQVKALDESRKALQAAKEVLESLKV